MDTSHTCPMGNIPSCGALVLWRLARFETALLIRWSWDRPPQGPLNHRVFSALAPVCAASGGASGQAEVPWVSHREIIGSTSAAK